MSSSFSFIRFSTSFFSSLSFVNKAEPVKKKKEKQWKDWYLCIKFPWNGWFVFTNFLFQLFHVIRQKSKGLMFQSTLIYISPKFEVAFVSFFLLFFSRASPCFERKKSLGEWNVNRMERSSASFESLNPTGSPFNLSTNIEERSREKKEKKMERPDGFFKNESKN